MHKELSINDCFRSLLPKIHLLARKYCCFGHDADDLTQEVAIKILSAKCGPRQNSGRWLGVVVRNTAIDEYRKQRKQIDYLNRYVTLDNSGSVCEAESTLNLCLCPYQKESAVEPDLSSALKKAIAALSIPLQQTFLLHALGYSYIEIAKQTHANVGTIRSRLHYAKKYLKKNLEPFR